MVFALTASFSAAVAQIPILYDAESGQGDFSSWYARGAVWDAAQEGRPNGYRQGNLTLPKPNPTYIDTIVGFVWTSDGLGQYDISEDEGYYGISITYTLTGEPLGVSIASPRNGSNLGWNFFRYVLPPVSQPLTINIPWRLFAQEDWGDDYIEGDMDLVLKTSLGVMFQGKEGTSTIRIYKMEWITAPIDNQKVIWDADAPTAAQALKPAGGWYSGANTGSTITPIIIPEQETGYALRDALYANGGTMTFDLAEGSDDYVNGHFGFDFLGGYVPYSVTPFDISAETGIKITYSLKADGAAAPEASVKIKPTGGITGYDYHGAPLEYTDGETVTAKFKFNEDTFKQFGTPGYPQLPLADVLKVSAGLQFHMDLPGKSTLVVKKIEWMEDDDTEDNIAAKTAVESAVFGPVDQADVNTLADARTAVEAVIDELTLNGVTAAVVNGAFTAATTGTVSNLNGTNGSYTFTVNLNKGAGKQQTTKTLTLVITATPYDATQDNADITEALVIVEDAAFGPVTQANVNTLAAARTAVEAVIAALSLNGVNAAVVNGIFTEAVTGTASNEDGIDGSYTFTVNLNKGGGTQQTTITLTLDITATPYNPQDDADITAAKTAVEGATFGPVNQANVNTQATARTAVQAVITALSLNGVNTALVNGTFTAAIAGTINNENGTNGSYTFTVNLNKGTGTQQATETLTLIINATPYDPTSVMSQNRVIPPSGADPAALTGDRVYRGENQFTAGSNPVAKISGVVNFFWQGKKIQSAVLTIFDASGNVINKIRVGDDENRFYNAEGNRTAAQSRRPVGSWNLTDAKGRQVSEGTYLVKGVITVDGKKEKVSYIIGVR